MNIPQDNALVKYIRKKSSAEETKQIEEWLEADSKNKQYLSNLKQLWVSREKKYEDYSPSVALGWKNVQGRIEKQPITLVPNRYRHLYKVAAAIVLIASVVFLLLQNQSTEVDTYTIVAKNGTEQHLLTDGSVVTLNIGSSITYTDNFGSDKRAIELTGEAFFEVARDESKPFTIQTGNTQTTVLGTSFNILQEQDKIEVSVVSGKVAFSQVNTREKVVLTKGEVGVQQGEKLKKETISDPNFLAWKTRKLIFNNQPLAVIVKDLSKVYNATFTIENTTDRKITAEFDNQPLDEVLEVIASTLDVDITSTTSNQYLIK